MSSIVDGNAVVYQGLLDNKFGETLVEAKVEKAEKLTELKTESDKLLSAVRHLFNFRYGTRLSLCYSELIVEYRTNSRKARPFQTCRKRWCPMCAHALSQRRWAALINCLPGIIAPHEPLSWVMLTLTVRNVPVFELKATVRHMLQSWRRLTRCDVWPAVGWLRSVELTINPDTREAHPHIHALLAVKPGYFNGRNYITQARWAELWQRSLKVDYTPIVDVRRVKPRQDLPGLSSGIQAALGGISEVMKYVTKPSDLSRMPTVTVAALEALYRVRMVEGGGILKGILSKLDDKDEGGDLLADAPDEPVERTAVYWWRAHEAQYRRRLDT
ncbi:protein rep [Cupriavidus sp.]|uniref:protein rep n=1 Tax=Cupriavidus sp. TaxID=1873897 RepID=UPI0025C2C804|nr:protein rep [Cupriavidus sp.]MCA3199270.1 protein rep [Cupriavidus sp.]